MGLLYAKTKSETPSDLVDFTSSSTPPKDQNAVVGKNGKTLSSSSEKISSQSEISRFESEFDCKAANLLGKGAFGVVFKAKHKLTKMDYAVKIVRFKDVERALREVMALSILHHSNIVRYYTCWLEDSGYQGDNADDSGSSSESSMDYSFRYLYIKMELCDTKTLRIWIDERNTQNVKKSLQASKRRERFIQVFLQLASGVEYIHSKMLIHRDLKPANIMFGQDGEVKIGDFGLVADENDYDAENLLERTVYKGTPSYMAPEQMSQRTYDRKVDMFALGLMCFEVLWKIPTGHERALVWPDIRKQKFPQRFHHIFPSEHLIIRPMLCVKPEERPEASQLKTDLERLNAEEIMRRGNRSM
ncbi:eukaryotic translation initiation factor 2-alpha kinase 3-like [Etheostoma cragini]|uniref:eukaryotic translation initiation factor 2-alpha kinase 3-like n=1 Tax=Etheostoma cragini TaxID=417921 RepID=UPI00155DE0F1|nr:eukaryotic translation initiation factor 2-alpha kinase 3-like [Etheostoma cragini]